ncbi:hypothetical protein ACQ4PT_011141 [Festuca glaucescens]
MEGIPRLRLWREDPPDYGANPDLFTVEVEHNGFFCGLGSNLTYILQAREMPMLSMLDNIFYKICNRMVTKDDEANKWHGTICPKIKKKVEKATKLAKSCRVKVAAADLFHVWSGEYEREYNVDLKARTCDCNRWQLSGIPCHHAIACCRTMRRDSDQYVHRCYSIEAYKRAYAYKLVPLRARVFWEKQPGMQIHPPLYTKVMGRPKKNINKAPEEKITKDGAKTLTRGGLTMHCSICGKANHNKKGHDKYMQSVEANEVAPTGEQEEEEHDIPSILQNIIHQRPHPAMDPTHQMDSMVYRMGQEDFAPIDYCPDSWDEPTFTGLAAGCPEVCRLHQKEPVKRVAFEGTNTGRRFYMCSVQGYIENCGFHSWLDDEWPQPMKNTLLKLWGMYHDMHNALLDEKIENGKLVKDLNEERIKVEKKYSSLMADVSKFMNDTERQVMQANYDKIMNGSEEEKLREIRTKLENELMKANDKVAMLKEGKIADDRKMKLMEEETLLLKDEKKKLEYQLFDLFKLSSARNDKLVKIKQICEQ